MLNYFEYCLTAVLSPTLMHYVNEQVSDFLAVCYIMYFYRTPEGVIRQDTNRASPHGSYMHNCTAHASEHQCIDTSEQTHIYGPSALPNPLVHSILIKAVNSEEL